VEFAAAVLVAFLLLAAFVYYILQREGRTQDELESIRGEMTLMGSKVAAITQSHAGARIMAENAMIRAQNAEAVASDARNSASNPVVIIVSPANDADIKHDKIKTQ
jgi:hypothetical protein